MREEILCEERLGKAVVDLWRRMARFFVLYFRVV